MYVFLIISTCVHSILDRVFNLGTYIDALFPCDGALWSAIKPLTLENGSSPAATPSFIAEDMRQATAQQQKQMKLENRCNQ